MCNVFTYPLPNIDIVRIYQHSYGSAVKLPQDKIVNVAGCKPKISTTDLKNHIVALRSRGICDAAGTAGDPLVVAIVSYPPDSSSCKIGIEDSRLTCVVYREQKE